MRVLFVGDIVGRPGRELAMARVPQLRADLALDYVVANAENAAAGFGATPEICETLLSAHIDALTMGNHVYGKKEIEAYLPRAERVIRPANYPPGAPGHGSVIIEATDVAPLAVLNLQGTVFMQSIDCPFRVGTEWVQRLRESTPAVLVDFHAEATAEKVALSVYLDGRCSAVVGTHTHVQTADERILPGGTAAISDVGMTGPVDSVIGMSTALIERRFVLKMPQKFEVASGAAMLCAVLLDIDDETGRARSIERIRE